MCAELHPTPFNTPPTLHPQSALCPPAWGQNSLLLQNRSPSGCLPTTPYTLTETAIPHPILNKCVRQGVFARFLWGGSLKGWGVGIYFELKSDQADRQRTQSLQVMEFLKNIFNFFVLNIHLIVLIGVLCLCICLILHDCIVCGCQKGVLDPLNLGLEMVVCYHVGAGHQT